LKSEWLEMVMVLTKIALMIRFKQKGVKRPRRSVFIFLAARWCFSFLEIRYHTKSYFFKKGM